jgi:APA family basic amino acid/polyamine antiporter
MANPLFQTKSVSDLQGHAEGHTGPTLKRTLGPLQLTMLGIGAIIGTGIFVLTGTAAAGGASHVGAGPAIVISFLVVAVACGLAALCYAEFASMIPIAGSAYTYAYASFGELMAWIIGWDLVLEYAVGNIAVAIGWSGYFVEFLRYFGLSFPAWLAIDPITASHAAADSTHSMAAIAQQAYATAPDIGFPLIVNLPAMLVTFLVTALLVYGIRESANLNTGLVFLKLGLIALFLFVGIQHVDFGAFWAGTTTVVTAEGGVAQTVSKFNPTGWSGIMTGAALIFFAYIGFDAVSTTAEEAKNPQRDLPLGMIASLVVCTILYIAVATVLTAMVPLQTLANAHPVAAALTAVGEPEVATIISLGASMAIISVLLVMQYGQTRIFYSMSRDGLLPKAFSRVHPRFQTPAFATILTGLIVAIPAGLIDIAVAAELSNIGTLFAFVLVAGGVLILRYKDPDRHRGFRVKFVWPVAVGCMLICFYLMASLTLVTWERFGIWLAIGLVIYFLYGAKHSELRKGRPATVAPGEPGTMSPLQSGDLLHDQPPGV